MQGASLVGCTLICARHAGCYDDVRQGDRRGGGEALRCHPFRIAVARAGSTAPAMGLAS